MEFGADVCPLQRLRGADSILPYWWPENEPTLWVIVNLKWREEAALSDSHVVRKGTASFPWMLLTSSRWPVLLEIIEGSTPAAGNPSNRRTNTWQRDLAFSRSQKSVPVIYLWPVWPVQSSCCPWSACPSPERWSGPELWPSCCRWGWGCRGSRSTPGSLWWPRACCPCPRNPAAPVSGETSEAKKRQ